MACLAELARAGSPAAARRLAEAQARAAAAALPHQSPPKPSLRVQLVPRQDQPWRLLLQSVPRRDRPLALLPVQATPLVLLLVQPRPLLVQAAPRRRRDRPLVQATPLVLLLVQPRLLLVQATPLRSRTLCPSRHGGA